MLNAILTHDLQVVCIDQGRLVQRGIDRIKDLSEIACITTLGEKFSITNYQRTVWFDFITKRIDRAIPAGSIDLIPVDMGIFSIKYETRYMRADNLNGIDFGPEEAFLWENFKLVDIDRFKTLLHVAKNKWSCEGKTISLNARRSNFKEVFFGDIHVSLEHFLNYLEKKEYFFDFVFTSGWKVYKAHLIKPAFVFVAFGRGNVLKQLAVSMKSLENPGNYKGDIFIITDLSDTEIKSIVPEIFHSYTTIINATARDQLDYVGARLSIFNSRLLDDYQPIIYSDADVIFDTCLDNFIQISASSEKCSAQIEPFHSFKESEHTGGSLFKQDPFEISDVKGFNGGILMVPNIRDHGRNILAAYTSLQYYTSQHGRDSIPFYDQSVLNYSLYKLQDFDPSPVSERTLVGGSGHAGVRALNPVDPENPKGFVHFWNSTQRDKDMEEYLLEVVEKSNYQ